MKKFLSVSVLVLSLSGSALASITEADLELSATAGASSLTGYPMLGFATISEVYLMDYVNAASFMISASTSGAYKRSAELDALIKANIQEYNLSGELSPLLSTLVSAAKDVNSELSTEDILFNLESNL